MDPFSRGGKEGKSRKEKKREVPTQGTIYAGVAGVGEAPKGRY